MGKRFAFFGVMTGLTLCSLCQLLRAAAPGAGDWLPSDSVVVLEVTKPEALLDPLLSPQVIDVLSALPGVQGKQNDVKRQQLLFITHLIELRLGTNWQSALRTLTGGGVTFALEPAGKTILAVESRDAAMLDRLHDAILNFILSEARKHSSKARISPSDYDGTATWSFGPTEHHAVLGNRLMLCNDSRVLRRALDLQHKPGGARLASNPAYVAAVEALPGQPAARLFVDLRALKKSPKLKQALTKGREPVSALLLADTLSAVNNANWIALGVYVEGSRLTLRLASDANVPLPTEPTGFASPRQADDGAWPALQVSRQIASLSLYRNLYGFYSAKDTLFPERTSGLVFFENMMGIFFSGLNLSEEVWSEFEPQIRLVVARQEYDPRPGKPDPELPAFALVARLKHPEQFGDVLEEAWQKAIGLANFTRGQKAQPGMIIDRVPHNGTRVTVAAFRAPKDTNHIDTRFNFQPSLAFRGRYAILSSTEKLAEELVDVLDREEPAPKAVSAAHSLLDIDGAQLGRIFAANRASLVLKNTVDKGHTMEEAEHEIGSMLGLLDCLQHAHLEMGHGGGHPSAMLELEFKQPERVATAPGTSTSQ